MRSLLLASAAALFSAGLACAQTTTSEPAPTGSPAHATVPVQPGMSPGNEGTSGMATSDSVIPRGTKTNTPTATPLSAGGSSGTTHTPPAQNTSSSSPDMMPGSGSTTMSSSSTGSMSPMPMHHHHMYMSHTMSMPMSASASAYLGYAKTAIMHHNKMAADDALSKAETRMLDRAVPASGGMMADSSPAISSIEDARKAVASGDNQTALKDIAAAQSAAQ